MPSSAIGRDSLEDGAAGNGEAADSLATAVARYWQAVAQQDIEIVRRYFELVDRMLAEYWANPVPSGSSRSSTAFEQVRLDAEWTPPYLENPIRGREAWLQSIEDWLEAADTGGSTWTTFRPRRRHRPGRQPQPDPRHEAAASTSTADLHHRHARRRKDRDDHGLPERAEALAAGGLSGRSATGRGPGSSQRPAHQLPRRGPRQRRGELDPLRDLERRRGLARSGGAGRRRLVAEPLRRTTIAVTACCHSGSSRPTTAASTTSGWRISTCSTSAGRRSRRR